MRNTIVILLIGAILFPSCYSFKGISIDYTKVKTFSIGEFPNNALNLVPGLSQDFREALRLKIINESRLNSVSENGDVQFDGEITGYDISAVAPQPGETTQFNRLTIRVNVEFTNQADEAQNFKSSFSWFEDFSSTENLADLQDDMIVNINERLVEDIFNKAFTNW